MSTVLIETLTGRRLYGGETLSDTLAAVLLKEPELDGLPGDTPPDIRRLLRRCLVKDAQQRLRDIGDARIVMDECLANPGAEEAEVKTGPFDKKPVVWIGAASLLAIVLAALAWVHFRENPAELPVLRLPLGPPDGAAFGHNFGLVSAFAVSPDGRRVAFVAQSAGGKDQLWVRSLSTFAAQPLPGTESASYPFWSPDSRFIGFGADGKLKKIDANGGPPVTLTPAANLRGGTWNGDVILFASQVGPLQRVSSAGGASRPATQLDPSKMERNHRFPWFLPDGLHFLCGVVADGQTPNTRIGSLDSKNTKPLLQADSNAIYASGYLLYLRESNLIAQPFDPKRMTTTGDGVPIAEEVGHIYSSEAAFGVFSASANGVLAYVSGESGALGLTWLDRTGKRLGNVGDPGILGRFRISPDGKSAAGWSAQGGNRDIWIYDLDRRLPRRFNVDPARRIDAIWSPDGRTVVFNSARKGRLDLYRKNADGSGAEELLYADDMTKIPTSWSPDGQFLVYTATSPNTLADVWVLPMAQPPGTPTKPFPWLHTRFAEREAVFSPDGKWVAYQSNESGRDEIYAAPFPGPGGKGRRVSTAGGTAPLWPGKEIFYVGGDNGLMAVPVNARGATLNIDEAHRLFVFPSTGVGVMYDVSAQGRILAVLPPEESGKTSNEALKFVQNWTAELKK